MSDKKIELIGIYKVEDDVYMLEIIIEDQPINVDLSLFVQKECHLSESDWQVPYDEHYLNEEGTITIGDFFNQNALRGKRTRVAFYMHLSEFKQPISTPYGNIVLPSPTQMPERLNRIIQYEPVD